VKTQHTPGPWTIAQYSGADKWIDILEPLVRVDYDDVDRDIQAGNARLISAAPDLLKAAQRALAVFKAQGESVRPGTVLAALSKAITKATGEGQS
jgi:hypothetical protein